MSTGFSPPASTSTTTCSSPAAVGSSNSPGWGGAPYSRRIAARMAGQYPLLDEIRDRLDDPRRDEREALGLLAAGDAREDQDRVQAGLQAGDDVGVHPVADHRRGLGVGLDGV